MPKVTIIIPTYNRADLIGEALSSVFSQTYRDFEIIVVDDGSTDDTASVLQPLIEQGLIKYVNQNNQGESAARNRGIAVAKGQYIAFLDSDDLFEPSKLELQVKYLQDHPEVGLVHSGFTKFDKQGSLGYRDTSWFSGRVYPRMILYWTTLMAVDAVLVPRKVLDEVGMFDESLHMGPDLDMWRRIARKYSFGFINKSLARVRVHEGNISGDKIKTAEGMVKYLEKAFKEDPDLSVRFRKRVFSRMFSTMAYNLLSESSDESFRAARLNALRAIKQDISNLHGVIALLSTILGYNFRNSLVKSWRLVRSWIMSSNRSA